MYKNKTSTRFALALCLLVSACFNPLVIRKPLNMSLPSQTMSVQFKVRRTHDYRISIMFTKGSSLERILQQEKIWGNANDAGTPTEFNVSVIKNGDLIFDERISATGAYWGQYITHKDIKYNTAVRLIKTMELHPGNYRIDIHTDDLKAFKDIPSFIEITAYAPKH